MADFGFGMSRIPFTDSIDRVVSFFALFLLILHGIENAIGCKNETKDAVTGENENIKDQPNEIREYLEVHGNQKRIAEPILFRLSTSVSEKILWASCIVYLYFCVFLFVFNT